MVNIASEKETRGNYFRSIRFKLLLQTVGLQMVIAIIFIVAAILSSNSILGENSVNVSLSAEQSIQTSVEIWRTQALGYAQIISSDPSADLVSAIHNYDTARIIELMRPAFAYSRMDGMTFANMDGTALARIHDPGNYGQDISSSLVIADGLAGRSEAYVFPTLHNGFAIAAGTPIIDGDTQVGVLFLSMRLDAIDTIDEMRRMTGTEVAIFQGTEPIMATFTQDMTTLGGLSDEHQASLNASISVYYVAAFEGGSAVWRYTPIPGRDGNTVGSILTVYASEQGNWVLVMWAILFIAMCAITTPLSIWSAKQITKPIIALDGAMAAAGLHGDIAITEEEQAVINKFKIRHDEIGSLWTSSAALMDYMNELNDELQMLAEGNLDFDVTVRSEKDTLSMTLQKTVSDLNGMFTEIQASSVQVASSSKQVSEGAHSLSESSSAQAASVEELSTTVSEVAQVSTENATLAEKAATLATNIKGSAEKGSSQMDDMMAAVRDINESSQNISKVIKSIDDIAFQTNILALNAAVEAARAGQHGKGFAVVAEEVRNLAAKSAEAAKDTEKLIADSMEKAELGSRIADETSASLAEIVSQIGESAELVTEIAKSSEGQTSIISQIDTSLHEVTNTLEQTNGTLQESAAASEEMSGQSIILEELISRFKLRNTERFETKALPEFKDKWRV